MSFFILCAITFTALIIYINQYDIDLSKPLNKWKTTLNAVKGSFLLGLVLIATHSWFNIDKTGIEFLHNKTAILTTIDWGLHRKSVFDGDYWLIFTYLFVHSNLSHIASNLFGLVLLSPYEKRVGAARFLAIFFFSGCLSAFINLYAGEAITSIGASAGIYGLAIAYFIDRANIWKKKWIRALFICFTIITLHHYLSYGSPNGKSGTNIDHLGHMFGALAGLLYIVLFSRKAEYEHLSNNASSRTCRKKAFFIFTPLIILLTLAPQVAQKLYEREEYNKIISRIGQYDPDCSLPFIHKNLHKLEQGCLRLANAKGYDAVYLLGYYSEVINLTNSAVQRYSVAALHHHPMALVKQGYFYEKGISVPQSLDRAMQSYKEAAELGHPIALLKIASQPETSQEDAVLYSTLAFKKGVFNWHSLYLVLTHNITIPDEMLNTKERAFPPTETLPPRLNASRTVPRVGANNRSKYTTRSTNNKTTPRMGEQNTWRNSKAPPRSQNKNTTPPRKILSPKQYYQRAVDLERPTLQRDNSPEMALGLYLKAADKGHAQAQYRLARLYYLGDGIPQDYKEAFKWAYKAVNQGERDAYLIMALLHYYGNGIEKDHKIARGWLEKSIKKFDDDKSEGTKNHSTALALLGKMVFYGEGGKKDKKQGMTYMHKANKYYHHRAQSQLADLYYDKGDLQNALIWYKRAALAGNRSAQAILAQLYYLGKGITQDFDLARNFYRKSALQGDSQSAYNLAIMYRTGKGGDINTEEAFAWFSIASRMGNTQAKPHLIELSQSLSSEEQKRDTLEIAKKYWLRINDSLYHEIYF